MNERKKSVVTIWNISSKKQNKLVKSSNGNGRKSITISHWNIGSRKWKNKIDDIQAMVDTANPDVLFVSEANLDESTPTHETYNPRIQYP